MKMEKLTMEQLVKQQFRVVRCCDVGLMLVGAIAFAATIGKPWHGAVASLHVVTATLAIIGFYRLVVAYFERRRTLLKVTTTTQYDAALQSLDMQCTTLEEWRREVVRRRRRLLASYGWYLLAAGLSLLWTVHFADQRLDALVVLVAIPVIACLFKGLNWYGHNVTYLWTLLLDRDLCEQ